MKPGRHIQVEGLMQQTGTMNGSGMDHEVSEPGCHAGTVHDNHTLAVSPFLVAVSQRPASGSRPTARGTEKSFYMSISVLAFPSHI